MTYAPPDLLAVQRYAQAKTGQSWASLGIIHSTPQGGGYHEGHDLLHAVGRAPEDPGSDYSYTESQRDRNGLTNAASAFDFGGGFGRFHEFNAWVVGRARAGDPRCRDIREIIHTIDGRTVRRFDALGIRSSGDSSHLTHTHFSFFRDSEGRRANTDNFLGLLVEFFDGAKPAPQPTSQYKEPTMIQVKSGPTIVLTDWATWCDRTLTYEQLEAMRTAGMVRVDVSGPVLQRLLALPQPDKIAVPQAAGAPTDAQVDAAVHKALSDPEVIAALGAAVASHIHVS